MCCLKDSVVPRAWPRRAGVGVDSRHRAWPQRWLLAGALRRALGRWPADLTQASLPTCCGLGQVPPGPPCLSVPTEGLARGQQGAPHKPPWLQEDQVGCQERGGGGGNSSLGLRPEKREEGPVLGTRVTPQMPSCFLGVVRAQSGGSPAWAGAGKAGIFQDMPGDSDGQQPGTPAHSQPSCGEQGPHGRRSGPSEATLWA